MSTEKLTSTQKVTTGMVDELAVELADAYNKMAIAKAEYADLVEETVLLGQIREGALIPELPLGTTQLCGAHFTLKISQRENISYPDKSKLAELYKQSEQRQQHPLFVATYREVKKDVEYELTNDGSLAEAIKDARVVKRATPTVTVVKL